MNQLNYKYSVCVQMSSSRDYFLCGKWTGRTGDLQGQHTELAADNNRRLCWENLGARRELRVEELRQPGRQSSQICHSEQRNKHRLSQLELTGIFCQHSFVSIALD